MTYFHPSNEELQNTYGYCSNGCDLDKAQQAWREKANLEWSRPFESAYTLASGVIKAPEPGTGCMSQVEADFFMQGARAGFQYIARRHNLRPTEMWGATSKALQILDVPPDDIDIVQELIFGWAELTAEMLERYRIRYPKRCPLLDVLCTMDDTCTELNKVQDWLLNLKGSSNRRRLDVLPALPDPDSVRHDPKQTRVIQANSWGVADYNDRCASGVFLKTPKHHK